VRECDILLHVVDASSRVVQDYIDVVDETLEDMEVNDKKSLLVFNKMDAIDSHRINELKRAYPDAVFISAERGIGLDKLENRIKELIEEDFVTKSMTIPAAKYEGVAFLHREANIIEKKYEGSDIKLTFSIDKTDLMRLNAILDNIDTAESVM
jgi:GTP-binding protein HflX